MDIPNLQLPIILSGSIAWTEYFAKTWEEVNNGI